MLMSQVQALLVVLELLNVPDMERKVAKDQHGYSHVQQEKHLLPQWARDANLTRYGKPTSGYRKHRMTIFDSEIEL